MTFCCHCTVLSQEGKFPENFTLPFPRCVVLKFPLSNSPHGFSVATNGMYRCSICKRLKSSPELLVFIPIFAMVWTKRRDVFCTTRTGYTMFTPMGCDHLATYHIHYPFASFLLHFLYASSPLTHHSQSVAGLRRRE